MFSMGLQSSSRIAALLLLITFVTIAALIVYYFLNIRKTNKFDRQLGSLADKLYSADQNCLFVDEHFELNLQNVTNRNDDTDRCSEPFFTYVDPNLFQHPTYKTFVALLDNYESDVGVAETVTKQEYEENWRFLEAIAETDVMKICLEYYNERKDENMSMEKFLDMLYELWFKLYKRSRHTKGLDSSGFEHVFVGETRGNKDVIGFHNWIQFYLQEKAGKVDYEGHYERRHDKDYLYTIKFAWKHETKPKGSVLIGCSPEFEIALYTLCTLFGEDDEINLEFGGMRCTAVCYEKSNTMIGTCFLKALH